MYLNCLCTCSAGLDATDAMGECDMRATGNVSLSTCIVLNWDPTLGMSQGKGKREGVGGGGGPANRPVVTYAACAKQPTERDRRTWCCAWTGPTLERQIPETSNPCCPCSSEADGWVGGSTNSLQLAAEARAPEMLLS
jgi:hypothetical protein